jgi:hypothetical protein
MMDLGIDFILVPLWVKFAWLYDVMYIFVDALCISPGLFIFFMNSWITFFLSFAWQGLKEMVEGEESL